MSALLAAARACLAPGSTFAVWERFAAAAVAAGYQLTLRRDPDGHAWAYAVGVHARSVGWDLIATDGTVGSVHGDGLRLLAELVVDDADGDA